MKRNLGGGGARTDERFAAALKSSGLFREMTENEAAEALTLLGARTESYSKNESFAMTGEKNKYFGLVLEGMLFVTTGRSSGDRVIIDAVPAGSFYVDCPGLGGEQLYAAAESASAVVRMDISGAFARDVGPVGELLRKNYAWLLCERLEVMNRRVCILSRRTIREKLAAYFEYLSEASGSEAGFTVPFDRAALADYLGADRSALSRELSKMKREGLIDYSRSSFRTMGNI